MQNSCRRSSIASVIGVLILTLAWASIVHAQAGTFSSTGSMTRTRQGHTATLLPNGLVLIVGGGNIGSTTNTAELYNFATGTFTATGSMAVARVNHTATLLQNGKVLITGGFTGAGNLAKHASAEFYDPALGTFSPAGNMSTQRANHAAALLQNTTVIIMGGASNQVSFLNTSDVYNPGTNSMIPGVTMVTGRRSHTATTLTNGNVLITGGDTGDVTATTEIFDPASGFSSGAPMSVGRYLHSAAALLTGSVLVTGGVLPASGTGPQNAEVYTSGFSAPIPMQVVRSNHSTTLIPTTGRVLVTGGSFLGTFAQSSAEIYDPETGLFSATGSMAFGRDTHTATALPNGKILIAGGTLPNFSETATAELYTPSPPGPIINLNCTSGTLQALADSALPGTTINVTGTCNENLLLRNEKQRLTINGGGTATITAPSNTSPAVNIRGKGILLQGFTITGGSNGVHINRGSNAVLALNIIQNSSGNGVLVDELAVAVLTNNTIQNNAGAGVFVSENSTARIGFNLDTDTSTKPNTIQNNAVGVIVSNGSSARIIGNTIENNTGFGIHVLRDSHADIASNAINGNRDGIEVGENSLVQLGEDSGISIYESENSGTNTGFGIRCANGGTADGRIGTLNGIFGVKFGFTDPSCVDSLSP